MLMTSSPRRWILQPGPFVCPAGCSKLELTLGTTWLVLFLSDGEARLMLQPPCSHFQFLFQDVLMEVAPITVDSGLWL